MLFVVSSIARQAGRCGADVPKAVKSEHHTQQAPFTVEALHPDYLEEDGSAGAAAAAAAQLNSALPPVCPSSRPMTVA